jgi:hypothetical protein
MTLEDIHKVILFYINKEQNAYVSHEEIDMVLDRAQMAQFNEYYSNPRLYRQDSALPPMGYGETQRINDALSPFKATYTFTTTSGGVLTLPSNYMYLISLYTTFYSNALAKNIYNAVQVLNEEELIPRLESQVIPVTIDDPICIMNSSNQIQLFPDNVVSTGKVFYFRRPNAPVYVYTPSGRTLIYSNTSTQLEWREADINNIIVKALSYYGLSISSADVIQFAEGKNQQGN